MPSAGAAQVERRAGAGRRETPDDRLVVGVVPPAAYDGRRRLFDALEQVFPVRFGGRTPETHRDLAAVVAFDSLRGISEVLPGGPLLSFNGSDRRIADAGERVQIGRSPAVEPVFRGRSMSDRAASCVQPLSEKPGDEILATCAGRPVWLRRRDMYLAAVRPRELHPTETLRDLFKPGDFMSLLPLLHLLKHLSELVGWVPPPLRAAIVLDDPNLHWTSYGYVRFPALVDHSRVHGYHVAFATIPLDLWYVDRRVARVFRENPEVLSLAIHGNTHVRRELARTPTEAEAAGLAAQALVRVERAERRFGLRVSRVMVPPHGDFDETTLGALAIQGFDASCWCPKPRSPLSSFDVADFADGGLPSIPRSLLGRWDDLPFRAFLGQPIVLEGHHTDLAGGLDLLQEAAIEVDRLGDPVWMSLGQIAETNAAARCTPNVLQVRMYSRRTVVTVPEGIDRLRVETPAYAAQPEDAILVRPGASGLGRLDRELPVTPGRVELRLVRSSPRRNVSLPSSWKPWPVVRRVLSEGRDRALPAVRAVRSAARTRT